MTQQTGNVNSLGEATGVIKIDVSSLAKAQVAVKQFAVQAMADLAPLSAALAKIGTVVQQSTALQVQALKSQTTDAQTAAKLQIAAMEAQSKASTDAANVQIANLKLLAAQQKQNQQQAASTPAPQTTSAGARGLTRAAFSIGSGASVLGMEGVSQAAFGIGALTTVVGEFTTFKTQIISLGDALKGMGGIIGTLTQAGSGLAVMLGAASGGLAASLAAILVVAAPLVVIFGGLALVMGELNRQAEAAKVKAKEQADINARIAAGGTVEEFQADRDAAIAKRFGLQITAQNLQDVVDQYNETFQTPGAGQTLESQHDLRTQLQAQYAAQGYDTSSGMGAVSAAIADLNDQATKLTPTIDGLNSAMDDQGAIANSNAAATNVYIKGLLDEAEFKRQIATEGSQQIQKQLTDARQRDADLNAQLAFSTGKARDAILDEMTTLEGSEVSLAGGTQALNGQIQVLEQALVGANIREAFQQAGEFFTKLGQLQASYNQTTERTSEDRAIAATNRVFDNLTKQAREAEDFIRQRTNAIADFQKSQQRAEDDFLSARAKSQRDYDDQQQEAERQHQDKMAQIIAQARLTILQAAANLDARAVYQEQQRRNLALQEENKNYTHDREQRQKAFEQQLQDQQEQYDLQRQRAIDDFNLRLSREDSERAIRQQREAADYALQDQRQQAAYDLQDSRRLADYDRQVQQLTSHYSILSGIQTVWQNTIQFAWDNMFANMAASLNAGSANQPPFAGGRIGGYASGTSFVPRNMLAYIHRGEAIIPASMNRAGGMGGMSVTVENLVLGDIGSYSESQVMALVEQGIRQVAAQGLSRIQGR